MPWARQRWVLAPSVPGFPGSAALPELDDQLDWLLATHDLLQACGGAGGDLVAVSVGTGLAADVAAVWSGAVRRLVLVSPLGLFDPADPSSDIFAQPAGALGELLCSDPARFDAHVALPDGGDRVEWTVQQVRAQEAAARLLWPVGDTGLARRLHRVTQPTMLVFGAEDHVLPPSYRQRFQQALPHARLEVVAGSGHLVDLDAPQTLARLVEGFLRSSVPAARGVTRGTGRGTATVTGGNCQFLPFARKLLGVTIRSLGAVSEPAASTYAP